MGEAALIWSADEVASEGEGMEECGGMEEEGGVVEQANEEDLAFITLSLRPHNIATSDCLITMDFICLKARAVFLFEQ